MDENAIPSTEEEWKKKLTPDQYRVLREKGTEAPGSGVYLHEHADGTFRCAACGNPLFSSAAKFDSHTGWPSFDQALPGAVRFAHDDTYGAERVEVLCAKCNSHLGHVFDDGPSATGKRFCMNSICLTLEKEK